MDVEQGFRVEDLTRMLRRRAWLVATVAGGLTLLAILVSAVLRNEFESYATLLVEPQTINADLVASGLPEQNINSRLHLIQMQILSRSRLSRIIDDLKLYPEESKQMTREEVIDLMRGRIRLDPVLPELEQEILKQQRDIQINTFRLSFRHHDATTAAEVTNRLARDFIDEHIRERVEVSGDTSEFIDSKLNDLSRQIAEVEDRIAQVKSENAGRLPEDFQASQRLFERAMEGIRAAERSLAEARSDESFFRQQALASGVVTGDPTSPAQRLELREIELKGYRARGFTDKHPDVMAALAEIAALREQIESGGENGSEGPLSLAQQNAQAEAQRASLRAASAQAELERLREQAANLETRLAETPRVAERLAGLDREHQHLFQSYQDWSNKRLEANVAADMERKQKGEQFRVLESAYPSPAPISPNRPLIIIMGLMLGLTLGGGVALLLEASDSSFHGSRSLQDTLRIPVLATVPQVLLESDRVRQRRARMRRLLAAGAVTGVVLVAAVAGNWTVNGLPDPIQSLLGQEAPSAPTPGAEG